MFRAGMPLELVETIERCLAKAADQRYASVAELAESLARFVPSGHEASRRIASILGDHRPHLAESDWPRANDVEIELELEESDPGARPSAVRASVPRLSPTECEAASPLSAVAPAAPAALAASVAPTPPRLAWRLRWSLLAAFLFAATAGILVIAANATPTRTVATHAGPTQAEAPMRAPNVPAPQPPPVVTLASASAAPLTLTASTASAHAPQGFAPNGPLVMPPQPTSAPRSAPKNTPENAPAPSARRAESPTDDQIMGGRK
jgi:hypothetical protein